MASIQSKAFLRSLVNINFYSALNFIGLSISLALTIIALHFVEKEYNVDKRFSKYDKTYRIIRSYTSEDVNLKSALLSAAYKKDIINELGISENDLIRVYQDDELVTYQDKNFFQDYFLYADANFFELFDYEFLYGSKNDVLKELNAVVISENMAVKYFGEENPLGETINIDGKGLLTVSGVLKTNSHKSHLPIDFVANIKAVGYSKDFIANKANHTSAFYLVLDENEVERASFLLEDFTDKYFNERENSAIAQDLSLLPLADNYFSTDLVEDFGIHGDQKVTRNLVIIAGFVLLIAVANMTNLRLSGTIKNLKAFGIRKTLGSTKFQFFRRELSEVFLITLCASLLGLALITAFNDLIPWEEKIRSSSHVTFNTWIVIFILCLFVSIVVGLYPSLVASSIDISSSLQKRFKKLNFNSIQNLLLGFQFSCALILVLLSGVMNKQYGYLLSKENAIKLEEVLLFNSNNKHSWKNRERILNNIKQVNEVKDVAMIYGGIPNSPGSYTELKVDGFNMNLKWKAADFTRNTVALLGLKILDGRDFDSQLDSDLSSGVLLNESAASFLGWPETNIIGKVLNSGQEYKNIIGVVQDYHYESLKNNIEPLVISAVKWGETFVVKMTPNNYSRVIKEATQIWNENVPNYPFQFRLLENDYVNMHRSDTRQKEVIYIFTLFAMLTAIIGVISLCSLNLKILQKEIAIRNVLGASVLLQILRLGTRFFKILALTIIVSWPLSWWFSNSWLTQFSYRITLNLGTFGIMTIMFISIISLLIIFQSYLASRKNPVPILRQLE